MTPTMTFGMFVTGTDTGVGKTVVSCGLLRGLQARFHAAVGMKAVAAGVTGDAEDDIAQLRAASSLAVSAELDNPYALTDAVSPHIAARHASVQIDIGLITARYRRLASLAQAVVVEGAGGFCVPLSDTHTGADLAQALALPVVLVVGLRLGCLNHALLTQEAIQARGLRLAGWVANRIDPAMPAQQDNIDTLRQRLAAPLLADLAWHAQATAGWPVITCPETFFPQL
jgi:dethiobiotin synthetase